MLSLSGSRVNNSYPTRHPAARASSANRLATVTDEPVVLDLPLGTGETGTRIESDSMGPIEVPAEHYWGAQTQRSLEHFAIGDDRMPRAVYRAFAYIKKGAAQVNAEAGRLPRWKADLIARVADEILSNQMEGEFPLSVWQTGSGTQSNMNVNEVIANRANQLIGRPLGSNSPIHPNDDVNLAQSSNDTFPTAMHMAAIHELQDGLLPSVRELHFAVEARSKQWMDVVKIGRTHLMDAVPLTVGQEWSGYAAQLRMAIDRIERSRPGLYRLAAGGTAVGTGLNAPPGFDLAIAARIADLTGEPYVTAPNKFAALAGMDAMVEAMSSLRGLAVVLLKFANDIRHLASGPRSGLAELILPANEPGSSIMPGKVNPTQCESMIMVCVQVIGEDTAVSIAGSRGDLELNVLRPVVAHNFTHSAKLLADSCANFRKYCIDGIELNLPRIHELVDRSLMLVTALTPEIGYENAAKIAKLANEQNLTLREAALATALIDPETFDRIVNPAAMTNHS